MRSGAGTLLKGGRRKERAAASAWPGLSLTVFVGAIFFCARTAHAQPTDVAAARDQYDRGAAAYDAGEYALAAQQLSKADAIVANDVALELALKAAVKANDAILAMDLALRADGRQTAGVLSARDDARAKMGGRVGRVTVTCPSDITPCTSTLDDAAFPIGQPRWVIVGAHRVVIDAKNGRQAFSVRVDPTASVEVAAKSTGAPVAGAIPPPRLASPSRVDRTATPSTSSNNNNNNNGSDTSRGGVSPVWFWIGAGVTAVLGGATIASAVDTRNKHDAFATRPSAKLSTEGVDAQLRTNLLFAGTAAGVILTGVTGLFLVRWGGGDTPSIERSPASATTTPTTTTATTATSSTKRESAR